MRRARLCLIWGMYLAFALLTNAADAHAAYRDEPTASSDLGGPAEEVLTDESSPTGTREQRRPEDIEREDGDAQDDASPNIENQTSEARDDEARDDEARDDAPDAVELTDELDPIEAALDELEASGIAVEQRRRVQSALEGEVLTANIATADLKHVLYVLERVARDGYQILLAPAAFERVEMVALRTRSNQRRGVDFIRVEDIQIRGTFRRNENERALRAYAALPPGGVVPTELADELRDVGYRAYFRVAGSGELVLQVEPGRSIRRVRVRGHVPLSERAIRRVLSSQARPGALARGECLDRKELRRNPPDSICPEGALACRQWEKDERTRLERYLVDEGYFAASARLGLQCGQPGQADLIVYLTKGKAYRARDVRVTGNASTSDQRWIRRVFRPRLGPILPIPKRITRKHVEEATQKVEREYAEPSASRSGGSRRELELPYPGVRIDTNYDRIEQSTLPARGRSVPLDVNVQLGNGVPTRFLGNDRITEGKLRQQIQLFKRREPATQVSAGREAENIRAYYQSRGHMLATIEGKYQDFGALKQLTFVIDEGPRVRVRSTYVQRPSNVPPAVMNRILQDYRRRRKIGPRGRFTDAGALADLGTVLSALVEAGYLCATAQLRLAFWEEGLDAEETSVVLNLSTQIDGAGAPQWLVEQLERSGLDALRASRRAGLFVRMEIASGPRVVTSGSERVEYLELGIPQSREIDGLPILGEGQWGAPRMLRDGPLRRLGGDRSGGVPLNLTLDRDVEREVSQRYREHGYPLADVELRWVYRDSSGTLHRVAQAERLTDPRVGMCREQRDARAVPIDTEIYVYEGRAGTFGAPFVRGNFKTRDYVLRREVAWGDGEPYSRSLVDATRRNIEGTSVAESVQIRERTTGCDIVDDPDVPCQVHEVVTITEAKDRLMDVSWGVGGATLDPLYGFLRPSFPNIFGTAWDFQLDGHYGVNIQPLIGAFCEGEACYERSGRASLVRRRVFASPLSFELTSQFQRRVTPARGQIDSALGELRFSWPVSEHLRLNAGYLVQVANISKGLSKPILGSDLGCGTGGLASCRPPNRREAIIPDRTAALRGGVTWQRVDNAFNPSDGFIANIDVLFASPYFGGMDWWLRSEISWQHFIPIPRTNDRLNLRYYLNYGHAIPFGGLPGGRNDSVPEIWRFFAGGTADLGVRGIEPQTLLVDIEEIEGPYGTATLRPVAQGGHVRALATAAIQVVTFRNVLGGNLAHSLFVDLGVLTQRWRDVVPLRDIRRSVGVNFIKWDIRIVTVSLGYAVLVPNSILPRNVRPTDDTNGRFVFDVGATF